jgi:hypothetical protein
MNNWCIVGFSCIFLLEILIFKGLTAQRLYKSFGIKGLIMIKSKMLEVYCLDQHHIQEDLNSQVCGCYISCH